MGLKSSFTQSYECFNEVLGILLQRKLDFYANQLREGVFALDLYFFTIELNLLSRAPLLIITSLYIIKEKNIL